MDSKSGLLSLVVQGDYALFSRPELKVERVSYDVITPSAARGIFEAICWRRAIRWEVEKIELLKPIRRTSIRRNELGKKIAISVKEAQTRSYFIEEDRQQRASLMLRDVKYLLSARIVMTKEAGPSDNPQKFREMFQRRAGKGQCFYQPYLGCREFAADFEWVANPSEFSPIPEDRDLGWMLYDIDHSGKEPVPCFFHAEIKQGVLSVPAWNSEEVRR